jgi:hypothetical protein
MMFLFIFSAVDPPVTLLRGVDSYESKSEVTLWFDRIQMLESLD